MGLHVYINKNFFAVKASLGDVIIIIKGREGKRRREATIRTELLVMDTSYK